MRRRLIERVSHACSIAFAMQKALKTKADSHQTLLNVRSTNGCDNNA
jgi:hypothetical protein